jgi:tetratricopeptide (TPR) repeat protein
MASFRDAIAIYKELIAIDPTRKDWLSDLLISYNRLGAELQRQQNSKESLQSYQASRAIAEQLTLLDPENVDWKLNAISTEIFLVSYDADPIPRLEMIVAELRHLKNEGKLSPVRADQLAALEKLLFSLKSERRTITSKQKP